LPTITSLPPLGKQLVLELEGGMGFAKRRNRLPSGFRHWHSRPFDEDVPHAAAKFGTEDAHRMLQRPTVM
jgi:hypothetical protein